MTQEFGKYLKSIRLDRGLTLLDVGAGIGCSMSTVSRLETQPYKKPTLTRITYISRLEKLYVYVPLSLVTRYVFSLDETYGEHKRLCMNGWSDYNAKKWNIKDYKHFGVFIKALRKARKLTTVGINTKERKFDHQSIIYVESNIRAPSFDMMAKFARYLDVDLLYLLSCYLYFDTSYCVPASRVELALEKNYKSFQAARQRTIMRKKVRENAI